jgi:predicted NBD/HSP70 family sugar kinase
MVARARLDRSLAELVDVEGANSFAAFHALVDAAESGNEAAARLVDTSATYLANAILGIVNVLDLDKVILAGPGFEHGGERYRSIIADTVSRHAVTRLQHSVQVEMRVGANEVAALGAASVLLHRELAPHRIRS